MENYEILFSEIEELENVEIPAGSGFGCNCGSSGSTTKSTSEKPAVTKEAKE